MAGGEQQIGLAAEEGGDLQNVDHFGDRRALMGIMHVGQHRDAEFGADVGQNGEATVHADAAAFAE